ncbi:DNA primase, partial [uncultured Algoriphagus sp.]|uniref:DNA primase n=1 Tax=uncultured Algoriphagus sp. TaxID=417365 RepID=UPI002595FCE5
MKINSHLIEQVRTATDIVALVQTFVPDLKRKGANWWALSPFKTEKTASFTVNGEKQIFKCFSTGLGGDVFSFLMEKEGMSFLESVRFLADRAGIQLEDISPEEEKKQQQVEGIYLANAWAQEQFRAWAKESKEFAAWAKDRWFTPESVERFQLGLSGSGWQELIDANKKYSVASMEAAGLAKRKEETNHFYDVFRNRIIFPIHNVYGKVVGFGGRRFLPEDKSSAKYVNTKEGPAYDKGATVYALHLAKDAIRNSDQVILTEGYTDVISLHQAGFQEAVASCGTALTRKQIQLIRRYSENVYLAMDGDAAGRKAILKHIPLLLSEGMNVKVVDMDEDDPDDFLQTNGKGMMARRIETAPDWLPWVIEHLQAQMGSTPADQAKVIDEVDRIIRHIPWDITQDLYRKEAAQLLDVEPSMVKSKEKAVPGAANKLQRRDWDWYLNLCLQSRFEVSADFSRLADGHLSVEYRDLKGEPYRITQDGKKLYASRDITANGKVAAVYIPPRLREYFSQKEKSSVAGVPLFLVEDEVTAWMLDSIGMFAIGIPARDGFLQSRNSKKLQGMLRQVLGQGFRHVIYLASGEMFSLPPKKGKDKPYRNVDAGLIAGDYVEVMKALKEGFGEVNAYLLHAIGGEWFSQTEPRPIEKLILGLFDGSFSWNKQEQNRLEAELTRELYQMLNQKESDLFVIHNISDTNLNYYKKIVHLHDPQAFFDFHGIEKLKDEFQLGKHLFEVNRDNEVKVKQAAVDYQLVEELDGSYWARTKGGMQQISDFVIHPVLKIKGNIPWVLAQIEDRFGITYDIVLDHKLLLNADQFHLRIYGVADCFFHGTNSQLRHLQQMIFKRMPQAYMMDRLGHQEVRQAGGKLSFYATGNGLITYDEGFLSVNEKGLVDYQGETFFLPAESGFELSDDRDEIYATHQKFSYESSGAKYEDWIQLFFKVHQRDAAHLGFSFYLMSLYRDVIYKVLGIHPNCYFQGETGTGKTTLRKSLSRLFGESPTIFCNDNPSVAAVGSLGLQASNALVILEEFNIFKLANNKQDWIIDIAKAFYDGKSRTTRQSAQNDFLKNKPIKAALLTCGQEPFYQYDEAVNNRFVMVEL